MFANIDNLWLAKWYDMLNDICLSGFESLRTFKFTISFIHSRICYISYHIRTHSDVITNIILSRMNERDSLKSLNDSFYSCRLWDCSTTVLFDLCFDKLNDHTVANPAIGQGEGGLPHPAKNLAGWGNPPKEITNYESLPSLACQHIFL